jgi:hypothetical protein
MAKITHITHQVIEHINLYFVGVESAANLRAWALAHPSEKVVGFEL